jgi:hypothetical protein
MKEKPELISPNPQFIEKALLIEPRWIIWRLEWIEEKQRWNKSPYNPGTRRLASSTNPKSWASFDAAWGVFEDSKGRFSGVGFMLGDGWIGVDLDGCRDRATGAMAKWATRTIRETPGYTEVSVSGTGVHVICRGSLPAGRRELDDANAEHRGIALYDKGRYLTMSGMILPESVEITDITPQLTALHQRLFAANGDHKSAPREQTSGDQRLAKAIAADPKLAQLWAGETEGYASQSEADLALSMKLVFWFGRDTAQIDQLFRQSGLMRDKWNREDYRERTLKSALEKQTTTRSEYQKQTTKPLAREESLVIYNADYPEPEPIVDAILYPGLTILGGRPKIGKSWFALGLALSIVSGQKLGGYLEIKKPGRVLYLSLEERPRQTRSRLHMLTQPGDYLMDLHFVYEAPALMAGGAAALDHELAEHPVEVLIVDSLLGVTQQASRPKNMDVMQADYNIVNTLRAIAEKHKLALVLVAHTRKAPGDFLDCIQGTTGTTAAADAIWVLSKTLEGDTILSITGRDVMDNVFGLRRKDDSPCWVITGEGDEVVQNADRREIIELLRDQGPMKPTGISRFVHKNVGAVQRLLSKLCDLNLIVRTHYGTYQVPGGASGSTGKSKGASADD